MVAGGKRSYDDRIIVSCTDSAKLKSTEHCPVGQIRGGVHRKHKSRGNQQQDIRCESINQEVPQGLVGRVGPWKRRGCWTPRPGGGRALPGIPWGHRQQPQAGTIGVSKPGPAGVQ